MSILIIVLQMIGLVFLTLAALGFCFFMGAFAASGGDVDLIKEALKRDIDDFNKKYGE